MAVRGMKQGDTAPRSPRWRSPRNVVIALCAVAIVGMVAAVLTIGGGDAGPNAPLSQDPAPREATQPAADPSPDARAGQGEVEIAPGESLGGGAGGAGDHSVDLATLADAPALARITHSGSGAFTVSSSDEEGERTGILIDHAGPYSGLRPINFPSGPRTARLEVSADGPWVIDIQPLSSASTLDAEDSLSGTGDDVVFAFGTGSFRYTMSHEGPGPFAAASWGREGRLLFVDRSGPFERKLRIPEATAFLEIVAEGQWTIRIGWEDPT